MHILVSELGSVGWIKGRG